MRRGWRNEEGPRINTPDDPSVLFWSRPVVRPRAEKHPNLRSPPRIRSMRKSGRTVRSRRSKDVAVTPGRGTHLELSVGSDSFIVIDRIWRRFRSSTSALSSERGCRSMGEFGCSFLAINGWNLRGCAF